MPLAVDTLSLGSIGTNCYLVRRDLAATDAAVIDPGDEAGRILATLDRLGARCAAILLTHSHYDHIGALGELAATTDAPVWLPQLEQDVFARPDVYFGMLGVSIPAFAGPSTLLAGGETIEAAGISFQVAHVPGHSPGHVSYYAEGALFSGDVLFSSSVGRVDLPGGDWESLLASIRSLAEAYPPETVVHSGHGPTTTLGAELARNPFLAELRA
jgi:hydroxyacylglutathione hydrolase